MPRQHVVAQGDSVESIAHDARLPWEVVWNAAANADLRKARKSPHVLLPGDQVVIPDVQAKTVTRSAGNAYKFKLTRSMSVVRVRFLVDGRARASAAYKFAVDDEKVREGTTNGDGVLEEKVSPAAVRAIVRFARKPVTDPDYDPAPYKGDGEADSESDDAQPRSKKGDDEDEYVLDLRHLDPASEVTGAQGRLRNLGYPCGDIDGVLGPRTKEALRAFQKDNALEVTGELDDATESKLQTFARG